MSLFKWMAVIFILSLLAACGEPPQHRIERLSREQEISSLKHQLGAYRTPATEQEKQQIAKKCSKYPEFSKCYDRLLKEYEEAKYYALMVNERRIIREESMALVTENKLFR